MTFSLRTLALALSLSGPVLLAACSSKDDPQPVQPTIEYGAVIGYADPIAALTGVTATAADGTTYQAQLNTSNSYVFGKLPVGNYTLTYTAATGYVAPAPQTITVIVNYTLNLPALTVQPVPPTKPELLTRPRWLLTGAIVTATSASGGTTTSDLFASGAANCLRDDVYTFAPSGTYVADDGADRCDPSGPRTTSGSWVLNADATELRLTDAQGTTETFVVNTLSNTTLQITSTHIDGGFTSTSRATFTAQ